MNHHHHGKKAVARARDLRLNATDPEQKLWYRLRELKAIGGHFRRQAPFQVYWLDFVEHRAKLVVELDGGQHGMSEQAGKDKKRDDLLISEGYRVLRFWNFEVTENMDGVLETIVRELRERDPHPKRFALRPPHKGEVKKKRPLPRTGVRRI